MEWTATVPSGWCMMDLHGRADGEREYGLCPLGATQCGCGCHRGERVVRRQPWTGNTDTVEDDTDESDDDD